MNNSIYSKIKNKTLLTSLISAVLVCAAVFFGIAYIRYYVSLSGEELGDSAALNSKLALEEQTESMLLTLAENKAQIADKQLADVSRFVTMLSNNATEIVAEPDDYGRNEVLPPNPDNNGVYSVQFQHAENVPAESLKEEVELIGNVGKLALNILENDDTVYTMLLGTETGAFICVDKEPGGAGEYFDPRSRPWYTAANENSGLTWSDIYADVMGRGLEMTCATPYYSPDGKMLGVVGVAIHLENLVKIIDEAKLGEMGYAFMLGQDGRVVLSEDITIDGDGNLVNPRIVENADEKLVETAQKMAGGESGVERVTISGKEYFVAYYGLRTLPWTMISALSVDEAMRPAFLIEQQIIEMKKDTLVKIDNSILLFAFSLFLIFVIIALLNISLTKRLAGKLAKPITELSESAKIIGEGNLNHRMSVKTGDEIEVLSDTFNTMIDNIKKITSEKERISAELDVARQIQASMLPCIFPPYPGRREFDIYANMLPAKEVGGDFYDFFFVDDDTLAVVIADVSGKGVPAALFMVITKTLIKNNAQQGKSPSEVFETVNGILCENNDAGMFVTAFMMYIDIKTGRLTYVNAGHNPPLIRRNGAYEYLHTSPGIVLAAFDGVNFKNEEIYLDIGNSLFMYTDGVTEASNSEEQMFGEARLLSAANKYGGLMLNDMLISTKKEIDLFVDGAEQADDITMVIFRRYK